MAHLELAAAAVAQLQSASEESRSSALPVLRTLLGNVQKDASEGSKFRVVKTTNAKIAALIAVPGAEQLLLAVGFERREAEVVLPESVAPAAAVAAASAVLEKLNGAFRAPYALAGLP